jgi:hypothetical protein
VKDGDIFRARWGGLSSSGRRVMRVLIRHDALEAKRVLKSTRDELKGAGLAMESGGALRLTTRGCDVKDWCVRTGRVRVDLWRGDEAGV